VNHSIKPLDKFNAHKGTGETASHAANGPTHRIEVKRWSAAPRAVRVTTSITRASAA